MKKLKRVLAVLLTAIMTLAMATTAFAAGNQGSLKVTVNQGNTLNGQTIKVYKLFDLTVSGAHYAYTVNEQYKEMIATALGLETGASELQHFFKIMIPVCKPIIAVLALWSFVGMWNSYFDALIYLNDADLQPLQLVLRSILVQNTPQPGMIADIQSTAEMAKVAELLKYATIVVSSLPLLIMYPFFQKYFDQGIMVGSVKG